MCPAARVLQTTAVRFITLQLIACTPCGLQPVFNSKNCELQFLQFVWMSAQQRVQLSGGQLACTRYRFCNIFSRSLAQNGGLNKDQRVRN